MQVLNTAANPARNAFPPLDPPLDGEGQTRRLATECCGIRMYQ